VQSRSDAELINSTASKGCIMQCLLISNHFAVFAEPVDERHTLLESQSVQLKRRFGGVITPTLKK
jgi:hypothetical protein